MLVINATQIMKNYSGVGVYSKKIIERIIPKWGQGKIYTQMNELTPAEGWEVVTIKNISRSLLRWYWVQYILPMKIKSNEDVLFSTFCEAPRRCKCKSVLVVHDIMPLKMPESHSGKLRYYYRKILPASLKNASAIITISNTVKLDIMEYFPQIDNNKIEVIYNGYDKNIFNTLITNKESADFKSLHGLNDYVLYVGRISEIKNTLTLIKAFTEVIKVKNLSLLIIGRDESAILPQAYKYTRKNNIEDRVKFIEYLNEAELAIAYNAAKIFVLPSFSEGFGLPVIEAMACGLPVIISDIPSLREVGDNAVLKFNPDSYTELSEKILELLNDDKLCNEMKNRALKRAGVFDWDKTAEQINNVLVKVMQNK